MILGNVHINDATAACNIHIEKNRISAVSAADTTKSTIWFDDAIAFPGLINSHDHLDFNCFPLLGNRTYRNYVAWGNDIHAQNKEQIDSILAIPKPLRVQWSLYKNLLNGVTTVVQHGEHFDIATALINVFQDCISIHSVRQEKNWKLRLNKPRADKRPVVIHIGEGTDADAAAETDELIRWNLLRKQLIGIHGVAMTPAQAAHFKALIWCPDSNHFLLGQTADIRTLKNILPVIFGTDATLTGSWNIWQQLRIALETGQVAPQELYDMATSKPAAVWGLQDYGSITQNAVADIVVARAHNRNDFTTSFFSLQPEDILLVIHNGHVRLCDSSVYEQLADAGWVTPALFSAVQVNHTTKFVYGDLPLLMQQIRDYAPGHVFPGIDTL